MIGTQIISMLYAKNRKIPLTEVTQDLNRFWEDYKL
jgi:hypothetical protein